MLSATSLPARSFLSFFLYLHVVFDKWKCGLLFEAGGMASEQISWELKFSFPWPRLNVGGYTRHLGEIYSLWDLGAEWRPWVLQVQWGAKKGSLSVS